MADAIRAVNPATEEVQWEYAPMPRERIVRIARGVRERQREWRSVDMGERAKRLLKLRDAVKKRREELARTASLEMGKPITESLAEVDKCAWLCEYYAENAPRFLADEAVATDAAKSYISFEPLGVVLCVMPWNFPYWQAFRFAVPALAAGNGAVLKHSNTVPRCALLLEELFGEVEEGVFKTLLVRDYSLVHELLASPLIDAASLTGSTGAGAKIAETAGKSLKKTVLELGGSDPFIVLDDADVPFACQRAVEARTINSGQSCIAAKRFILTRKAARTFVSRFVEYTKALKVGDPLDPKTQVGPLANREQLEKVERQVNESVKMGARVACGGKRRKGRGYFYEPTVLTRVTKKMPVLGEEVFGPAAPVIVARDDEEAIRIANDTDFGLAASLWTRDLERAEELAKRLQVGAVSINGIVKSDPRLPFGGVKKSGYGRELGSFGIREFVSVKAVKAYKLPSSLGLGE